MAGAQRNAKRRKAQKAVKHDQVVRKVKEVSQSLKPGAIEHLRSLVNSGKI